MNLNIRAAQKSDLDALLVFSKRTFVATYGHLNTPENMADYIKTNFDKTAFAKEFESPSNDFTLAFVGEQLVAYTKTRTDHPQDLLDDYRQIELERIYVDEAYKGQKIGQIMLEHCLDAARDEGFEVLWLGVWSKNEAALRFYKKMNFEQFDTHLFQLGDDLQTDYLMKISL